MKACKPRKPIDPVLRRYTLTGALLFGFSSLIGGFYLGLHVVAQSAAAYTPTFELFFINTFIAISCGAAGVIFGAFVGSLIYRFKSEGK